MSKPLLRLDAYVNGACAYILKKQCADGTFMRLKRFIIALNNTTTCSNMQKVSCVFMTKCKLNVLCNVLCPAQTVTIVQPCVTVFQQPV